jgi:hypothetical protein
MTLFYEIGTSVLLIIFTLWLQSAGLAVLIFWVRRVVARDLPRLGPFRSAALVVRLTAAVIVLHGVLILFWAGSYRWLCLSSWESAVYFSASSYVTAGYGDVVLLGAPREHHRRVDVRNIRQRSVSDSHPACRPGSAVPACVNLIPVVGLA